MTGVLGSRRTGLLAAMVLIGATGLAGCAESSGGGNSAGGEGLDIGASMEDYQAAFEDVDEITLLTQTPAPKGSVTGLPMEDYFEAVEEWSGGKIKWDISYSNAVAEPTEIDDALVDGRLDFGSTLPIYEPSEYPANAALIDAGFLSDQSAVEGTLSSNAWPNQVAFDTDEVIQEYDDHGMVAMLPVYNSGAQAIFCAEPRSGLDDLKGASISSSGTALSEELEALGATPTSIQYTELFESLQRGVVDCAASTPTVGLLGGFLEESPYGVIDPAAGLALAPGSLAFSKTTWESLPLVAQQLLWDRLDVFVASNVEGKIWENVSQSVTTLTDAGGGITDLDDDARTALQDANDTLLEEIRNTDAVSDGDAFVDDILAANENWQQKVSDLGLESVDYQDFPDWWAANKDSVDLTEFTTAFTDEVLAPHRPS